MPYLAVKDTGVIISDSIISWTGWQKPRGIVRLTPLGGGAYLQKTSGGVVQCGIVARFASRLPNAHIDNYFDFLDTFADITGGEGVTLEFEDPEGFTTDVWAFEVAGGVTTDTVEDLQEFWNPLHSFYAIPISLMRTGYVT
jgi:hypothetical protein